MNRIAVFGIGSTNFRSVLGSPSEGFFDEVATEPTRPYELETQTLEALERLAAKADGDLDAVGIATAGLVDDAGTVFSFDTPGGETVPQVRLGERIEASFGLPTAVANDCTASALGEYAFGAGADGDYRTVAHVTFGTGIGGGVVEDGHLLRGEHGHAGEVGLLPIVADGDLESCGVRGAWEAYCSGRGIGQYVRSLLAEESRETTLDHETVTAEAVFEAVDAGDQVAEDYLDRIGRLNAAGLGGVCNAHDPGLVTVGGGVALNNAEVLLEAIEAHLDDYLFVERPALEVTPLGDFIGLYGSLALADQNGRK
ncbi:ROK family protein [Saliphagus sp. GCM10025317]